MWNRFVVQLLDSRFHFILSGNIAVLKVTGVKSGNTYHFPVNYIEKNGKLVIVSSRDRTWWRNLRGGASLGVRLRGEDIIAEGVVLEDPDDVRAAFHDLLSSHPQVGRWLKINMSETGAPDPADMDRVVRQRVLVYITT